MKNSFKKFQAFFSSERNVPFLLLLITIFAYGLLFRQLGFYWDDLPISWIRYQFGPDAMSIYFSSNRPVWGLLYQITTRIFPDVPFYWQLFAVFWRWGTALLVWAVIRELWPARPKFVLTVSLFFLLYPGFNQQWESFLFSHFFIVLCFFLFSFLLMLWSFRYPKYFWLLTALSLIFSALNLWMMEYFFTLEAFRLFIILYFVIENDSDHRVSHSARRVFGLWLPYLLVFLADVYWRLFVFNDQIYHTSLLSDLKNAPLTTLPNLAWTILSSLWTTSVQAWAQAFQLPDNSVDGFRTILFYLMVIVLVFLAFVFHVFSQSFDEKSNRKFWPIILGLVAMFLAGWPFWLIELPITLGQPANRFTLPFMLGVSLLFAGLLELIPARIRLVIAAVFIAFAAGRQALWADSFRRDWITQKNMFWQMYWRAPGLEPNTTVLINQGPLKYEADNSLSATLNWIYDPSNHRSDSIPYVLFFPTNRVDNGAFPGFESGLPVTYDYLIGKFSGNTSQVIAFYYEPPGCLRLLDPLIDSQDHFISVESMMRDAAPLSSSDWITTTQTAIMPQVYGPEPVHGFCYYFEQADLARQMGDWSRVAKLGDVAFRLSDYPNDPVDRFVFIEGYAHEGEWSQVQDLSITSFKVSPSYVGPLLCKLLLRIDQDVPFSDEKQSSLNELRTKFQCLP